ncbi:hypothetical protein U6A24_17565 [Aquimarina gracilis]|uniref:Uncharacterized protein n=1 Tax=Aquimarina gracilis TaxID=874422 RepID=A0ABU5ZZG3_9FLAO|nr:hypothetical protein [Aquimarina gracilis]MEB3347288.1 hypothetical protein [Aquimarina gracilis]
MEFHECNLNIRYDLSIEIWTKVELVYSKMPGWLGYGKDCVEYEGLAVMKTKNTYWHQ